VGRSPGLHSGFEGLRVMVWCVFKWHIRFIDFIGLHIYIYIYIYIHHIHIILWCSMIWCSRYWQFFPIWDYSTHYHLRPGSVFAGAMAPPCAAQALQAGGLPTWLWKLWQWKKHEKALVDWLISVDIHFLDDGPIISRS
jgi:hypothetical protein